MQMNELAQKSSLDGLWVLLVNNQGQLAAADDDARIPVMARTANDETYVLGFKNMVKARQFMVESALDDAEPRMVVQANKSEYLRIAHRAGVTGVLVDYDPTTQCYGAASELY